MWMLRRFDFIVYTNSVIGCADDRRRIIRVDANDALRTSAHPMQRILSC